MNALRSWLQSVLHSTGRIISLGRSVVSDSALDPFPLRRSLLGYGRRTFRSDFRAGLTVAMIDITQGMAYALVAGLPLHYGITCSAIAAIVAPLLASSRQTILGPTNATAFMVFYYFSAYPHLDRLSAMPLLVFMTAALLLAGAFLRVADLTQYIRRTVVVAYVTGAAMLITAREVFPACCRKMRNSASRLKQSALWMNTWNMQGCGYFTTKAKRKFTYLRPTGCFGTWNTV